MARRRSRRGAPPPPDPADLNRLYLQLCEQTELALHGFARVFGEVADGVPLDRQRAATLAQTTAATMRQLHSIRRAMQVRASGVIDTRL